MGCGRPGRRIALAPPGRVGKSFEPNGFLTVTPLVERDGVNMGLETPLAIKLDFRLYECVLYVKAFASCVLTWRKNRNNVVRRLNEGRTAIGGIVAGSRFENACTARFCL